MVWTGGCFTFFDIPSQYTAVNAAAALGPRLTPASPTYSSST
jgi:hypothetical protein